MTCAEKYVCPFCGAKGYYENVDDIIDQNIDVSNNFLWQLVSCQECGSTYEISFELNPESVQVVAGQAGKGWD